MTPQQKIEQTRRALQMEILGRVPEPVTRMTSDGSTSEPEVRTLVARSDESVTQVQRSAEGSARDVNRLTSPEARRERNRRPSKLLDRAQRLQTDNRWLFDTAASVAQAWWVRQPAYTAVRLAEPALATVARRSPWRLLGVAALLGAGVVVLRPWRVAAVSSVLAASVRTPSAHDVVGSLTAFMGSLDGRLHD